MHSLGKRADLHGSREFESPPLRKFLPKVWVAVLLFARRVGFIARRGRTIAGHACASGYRLQVLRCIRRSLPGAARPSSFHEPRLEALTRVVWLAKYGSGWVTFVDDGTFSPGVLVKHYHEIGRERPFQLKSSFQNYYSENVEDCRLVGATFAGGTTWKDPAAPAQTQYLPVVPKDDAVTEPAVFSAPDGDPVGIVACTLDVARNSTGGAGLLSVRFKNISPKVIDSIVFRGLIETTATILPIAERSRPAFS